MLIMVTGAKGLLGQEILRRLRTLGIPCTGVGREDFDVTDPEAVYSAVNREAPDVIIHCAGYTAVDQAETEPAACCRANAMGSLYLARAALSVHAKLCLISSDYVFGGDAEGELDTDSPCNPRNVYGLSKLQAEDAVRSVMTRFFIVRTAWLFGRGPCFPRTMLQLGREKPEVRVVCDQFGSPTYAPDLADFLCNLVRTDRYGICHATNEGFCSRAEFAEEVFRCAGLPAQVIPIPSSAFPAPARRPANARLSKASLDRNGFPRLPPWQDAVKRWLMSESQTPNS